MKKSIILLIFTCSITALGADSVDVVFRYNIAGSFTGVSVPGEFNNWNNTAMPMAYQGGNLWTRTVRLAVGGKPAGTVPGAWQYKFFYTGASSWPNDPLNHHINVADNNNSFIYLKDPTIYQFLPNQRNPVVTSSTPLISAYIFPKVGSVVDTSSLSLIIDGTIYSGLGSSYNFVTNQLAFTPPTAILNGNHTAILIAGASSDTVTFTTQAGFIQITNESPFTTWKSSWTLNGLLQDSTITSVKIVRNGIDIFTTSVSNRSFLYNAPLIEGANSFVALVDSSGSIKASASVTYTRKVNHTPTACGTISLSIDQTNFIYDASCSTNPDTSSSLNFLWAEDTSNPQLLGIDGLTQPVLNTFTPPTIAGEYHVTLIVGNTGGNKDTANLYFEKEPSGKLNIPGLNDNPAWAKKARIYFLFPKSASAAGTINGAALRLQSIKDLGFNVIWMMPVMKNAAPINNNSGPGYNIVDFYNVAPEYGTNQDFKNFVTQAHALGIKVILDVTPNHSSRFHPWCTDAHSFKTNSPYWNWYEHQKITVNTNGLGDCLDADGFNYYCGFSDQLMNFNWSDIDMRTEMINVYQYWIKQFGIDGYRLDVYWGPHRRYGEQYMGNAVRAALKHIKPDILLLGEDDGTGPGTQTIYADYSTGVNSGGIDAAYDFKLYFNQIRGFYPASNISALHNEIDNGGYYPGSHSLYMRFMESQDEDRIVYFYSNNFALDATTTFHRTMPMASTLFTMPGIPMIWNGQEIGWGYGMSGNKDARSRSVIDWNYQGRFLLAPHYQKLATIRGQFPAFTQHKQDTNHDGSVTSSDTSDFMPVYSSSGIYAFTRPYPDQNGLTVVNFSASSQIVPLNLAGSNILMFTGGIQATTQYYLNNLYDGTRQQLLGSDLDSVVVDMPPYGTAIYTISTTPDSVIILNPLLNVNSEQQLPKKFALAQNYPNPFNPTTSIRFQIAKAGFVSLKIYDLLGREIARPVHDIKSPGTYTIDFDATHLTGGVYFYRLESGTFSEVKKMLLVR